MRNKIEDVYGYGYCRGGYFVYDPVTTLKSFQNVSPLNEQSIKVIREKLVFDWGFNKESDVICRNIGPIEKWIERNVAKV